MTIWIKEIKSLEKVLKAIKGNLPELENELERLVITQDENMLLVYSRRCLEVMVTYLCKDKLNRERGTEPLKGILDKLGKEDLIAHNIVVSMHGVNNMSTFGAHPKEFDLRQVRSVLTNLEAIIFWYVAYRKIKIPDSLTHVSTFTGNRSLKRRKNRQRAYYTAGITLFAVIIIEILTLFNVISFKGLFKPEFIDSIAILPFDNFTGNDSLEYFVAGMHASLIGDLGQLSGLRVIGKTSANAYKNTQKSVQKIADELSVDAVIEAEVMCIGDSICVQFKLISIYPDEKQIWIADYKEDKSQILNLYTQVTKNIADEVRINLTQDEKKNLAQVKAAVHPDVLDAYYKGIYQIRILTPNGQKSAINYFNKALELDPDFAPAHAGLSGVWAVMKQMDFVTSEEADPNIEKHLIKAQTLDSAIAEVYYYKAVKSSWTDFDWEQGRINFEKAIELRPNFTEAIGLYSHFLMMMNEWEEARKQMNTALIIDPNNPFVNALDAMVLLNEENYQLCLKNCEELEKMMPNNPLVLIGLFYCYRETGMEEKSIEKAKRWISQAAGIDMAQFLEDEYKRTGYNNALKLTADSMAVIADSEFIPVQMLYTLYAVSGNLEKGLHWLERAFIKRDPTMPYLACGVFFKPFYNEPRFIDLVKRMKLEL